MVSALYPDSIKIFNRKLLRDKRDNLSTRFTDHNFLFEHCTRDTGDRLLDINRDFTNVLQIGTRGVLDETHPKIGNLVTMDIAARPVSAKVKSYIQGDEELLPVKQQSLDLVLSVLNMHSVNDLPGALIQIRQALKPDGLFMACLFGGETLMELRQSLMHTEIEMLNGASPRVFPFIDKMQMGDLLQRARFALPVIDSEIIKVTYATMFDLLRDIKGMGEGNIIDKRSRAYAGRGFFTRAAQYYQENFGTDDHKIEASFEIIHVIGWAPHSSQQKPLQPGSAEFSLAEALQDPQSKD